MARETLKNFLNKIGKTADKITYKVNPATGDPNDIDVPIERGSSDLGIDPNTLEPLIDFENKKGLLGDFLSDLSQQNEFKIEKGTSLGLAYKRGENLTNESGSENKFVNNSILEDNLNSYSNSKFFNNLNDIVDKNSKNFTNHSLLKDIAGGDLDRSGETLYSNNNNTLTNTISDILKDKNRYANNTDSTAFSPKGTLESNFESDQKEGTFTIQNEHGKYEKNSLKLSLDELKKIGLSMLYKASGYDRGTIPGDSIAVDNIENNEEIIPEYVSNNTYKKVNFNSMRSLNAKNAPQGETGRPYNEDNYFINTGAGKNKESFGQTYNDSVHFDGKNKNILRAKAIVACKAVMIIAKDFYSTIASSINLSPDEVNPDFASLTHEKATRGPFFLGSSRGVLNANLDLIKRSLIAQTKYSYSDCIDAGFQILFGETENDEFDSIIFQQQPGHLLAICLATIKSYESFVSEISTKSSSVPSGIFKILQKNKIFKFINVIATMGDRALESSGGNRDLTIKNNARNVDKFKDIPGNRVSKFRKRNGRTQKQVAWNSNETPNAYLLPTNIIRATAQLNMGKHSPNPVRGMLGSELALNTYMSIDNDGAGSRIPNQVVKELEDQLDAEYVPFYIHDLRTNEIISFHAFLDSISDTISPNFSPTPGYGRMDPVQIYNNTTRNVSVSFTWIATSKEDFNLMWYKINKLTTLAYPQWTQGTKVSNGGGNVFIQPFSQVIGASPLVRLRVGDLIKSNYSRFNLARLFGIGDPNIKAKPLEKEDSLLGIGLNKAGDFAQNESEALKKDAGNFFNFAQEAIVKTIVMAFGSPAQIGLATSFIDDKVSLGSNFELGSPLLENLTNRLRNGFVNPLVESAIIEKIQTPNTAVDNLNAIVGNATSIIKAITGDETGLVPIMPTYFDAILLANTNTGYRTVDQRIILLSRSTKIKIIEYHDDVKIMYKVKIADANSKFDGEELFCEHSDIYADPDYLFLTSGLGYAFGLVNGIETIGGDGLSLVEENFQKFGASPKVTELVETLFKKDEVVFMEPENNPFVKAYESTKGRGLAGALSAVQFTWGVGEKYKWETDWNSRAPMGCKVSFTLSVIHDIPPGLDHSGFNRAPIYNVGEIMHDIAGDPYEDGGSMSKFRYDTGREDKKIGEE